MNGNRVAEIIRQKNQYKALCGGLGTLCALLFVACLVVIWTGTKAEQTDLISGLLVLGGVLFIGSLAFIGSGLFGKYRGNTEMGIGDTQGRHHD